MKKICTFFLFYIFLNIQTSVLAFEQIQINYPDKSANEQPTQTYYYKGTNSKALLVYLPGGTGSQQVALNIFALPFIDLSNKNNSKGHYDLATFISAKPLESTVLDRNWYNATYQMRSDKDHILRVESVMSYYKSKTKLPIILFGHSNGGISIEVVLDHLIKENKINLLSGIIVSESKDTQIDAILSILKKSELNLPIILLNHEKTRCYGVSFGYQQRQFEKFKEINKAATSIITIQGGQDSNNQPCYSGYHMFYLAHKEVLEKIESELDKIKFK